jgi:hypothetical protein
MATVKLGEVLSQYTEYIDARRHENIQSSQ